jgi:serine/threonine protein kinase
MIKIPNYIIKNKLEISSVATTYLAENTILNHKVSLRVIHHDSVKNNEFHQHFLAVGKRISHWEHPHLVKIYDVGITNDNIFYSSMEYLEKESLRKKILQKNISVTSTLKIIREIGEALSYIHNQGFIHGDLKLENILFDHNGITKLLDNGCTELKNASGDLALQDNLHYMSPEQATMTSLDQRTDIYSLGLIIYEVLVGEKAFFADSIVEAIYQHTMLSPPDLPAKYNYLQPVLDKALAKSPHDRYTTIEEMLQALDIAVDTFNINRINNHVETEYTKKKLNKGIYVKHQSVYVENQSVYVSHHAKQDKPKKTWWLRGFLVLLTLLAFLFNSVITIDNPNKDQPISKYSYSKPHHKAYVNPVSFIEKNKKVKSDDRNIRTNKISEKIEMSNENTGSRDRNNKNKTISTEKHDKNSSNITLEKKLISNVIPTSKVLINVFSKKNKKPLKANIKITAKETNKIIFNKKNIEPNQFEPELEVGEYKLRIKHKGYISQSKTLKINDIDKSSIIIHLEKKAILMGKLKVQAVNKKTSKSLRATYEVRGIDSTHYNEKKSSKSAYFKLPIGKYELLVSYKARIIKKQIVIKQNKTVHKKIVFSLPSDKNAKKPTKTNPPKKIIALGYIHISAKLDHETGKKLPADFFLYRNHKMVKKAFKKNSVRFKVPTGKYVIKVIYKGVSSQAKAVVEKGDIIEQTFIYDGIPTLP